MSKEQQSSTGAPGFFDDPKTGRAIIVGLVVACVVVVASDLFYHKHGHFDFEQWFGFHAAFGFVAYLLIVNSAKLLRLWVRRPEDYYGGTVEESPAPAETDPAPSAAEPHDTAPGEEGDS